MMGQFVIRGFEVSNLTFDFLLLLFELVARGWRGYPPPGRKEKRDDNNIPWVFQDGIPHPDKLGHDTKNVQVRPVRKEEVPEMKDLR